MNYLSTYHYKRVFTRNCSENITILRPEYLPTDIEHEYFDHTWDFPFTCFVFTFDSLQRTEFCSKIWQLYNNPVSLACVRIFKIHIYSVLTDTKLTKLMGFELKRLSKTKKLPSLNSLYLTTFCIKRQFY